jgi:hypothetical protein
LTDPTLGQRCGLAAVGVADRYLIWRSKAMPNYLNFIMPLVYMAINTLFQLGVVLIGLALVIKLFARNVFRVYFEEKERHLTPRDDRE